MKRIRGYTLIEIMVVLIIIGIIATVALFAVGDFGQSKKVKAAAQQFNAMMSLAEQQAMLTPAVLGVSVSNKGYIFYQLLEENKRHDSQWQRITRDPVLRARHFPRGTQANLLVPGLKENKPGEPQIVISPTGEISEFTLDITNAGKGTHHIIRGHFNGEVTLHDEAS